MDNVKRAVANIGFTTLYEPSHHPQVDIVFVHGLQGHPFHTWADNSSLPDRKQLRILPRHLFSDRSPTPSSPERVLWPRDLLPEDCPKARILTWGYDSNVSRFFGGSADSNNLFGHAKDLLYALHRERLDCKRRPIIFLAHSLGGLVVKEVLRRSGNDEDKSIHDIFESTCAVFFLGTPHRGSNFATLGNTIRQIVTAVGFDTNEKNIKALQFDSFELELSREEFAKQWRQGSFQVRTFQESRGIVGVRGLSGKVVPDFSSSLDDPRERAQHIDAHHMDMCRFRTREDSGYVQVVGELKECVDSLATATKSQNIMKFLRHRAHLGPSKRKQGRDKKEKKN